MTWVFIINGSKSKWYGIVKETSKEQKQVVREKVELMKHAKDRRKNSSRVSRIQKVDAIKCKSIAIDLSCE